MKRKYYLIFLVLLLSSFFIKKANAQKCLMFRYDADGNRIQRTVNYNCYEMKNMEEVQDVFEYNEVEVYPNPTYESFKVFVPERLRCEAAFYELFDMSGVVLSKNRLRDNETEVDIGAMSAGIYILKITNGDDVMTKMILKY